MIEALQLEFMRNAVLAGLLASVACGLVGSLVVVNRIVFMAGGVAHSAYGGIGLALFLGISPLLGAVGFTVAIGLIMAVINLTNKQRADAVIGVTWAAGMALGVILIDLSPGYRVDMMSYLFGSILTASSLDISLAAGLDLAVLAIVGTFYWELTALSYDDDFAASRGIPTRLLYVVMIVFISLTVVLLIRIVGLILVIALLTIPPYIAEGFCRSLKTMMVVSIALCAVFIMAGLALAYRFNLTSGPCIVLLATAAFFVFLIQGRFRPAGPS